jgi:hypothetical protein
MYVRRAVAKGLHVWVEDQALGEAFGLIACEGPWAKVCGRLARDSGVAGGTSLVPGVWGISGYRRRRPGQRAAEDYAPAAEA